MYVAIVPCWSVYSTLHQSFARMDIHTFTHTLTRIQSNKQTHTYKQTHRLLSAVPLLIEVLQEKEKDKIMIAFPDEGAYKRFHLLFPADWPTITCHKRRNGDKREVEIKEGRGSGVWCVCFVHAYVCVCVCVCMCVCVCVCVPVYDTAWHVSALEL